MLAEKVEKIHPLRRDFEETQTVPYIAPSLEKEKDATFEDMLSILIRKVVNEEINRRDRFNPATFNDAVLETIKTDQQVQEEIRELRDDGIDRRIKDHIDSTEICFETVYLNSGG